MRSMSTTQSLAGLEGLGDYLNFNSNPLGNHVSKNEKELIIIACYINVGNMNTLRSKEKLHAISCNFKETVKDIQENTNYLIKFFVLPVKEGKTKMECIFPNKQSDVDISKFEKLLDQSLQPAKVGLDDPDDFEDDDEDLGEGEEKTKDWENTISHFPSLGFIGSNSAYKHKNGKWEY